MADREKVIKGLTCCRNGSCLACPYNGEIDDNGHCEEGWMNDAIALLKEQEPITNTSISSAIECLLHPQDADDSDMAKAIDTAVRAMRTLKEQEAVEPRRIDGKRNHFIKCGNCNYDLVTGFQFCPRCGLAVKWGD